MSGVCLFGTKRVSIPKQLVFHDGEIRALHVLLPDEEEDDGDDGRERFGDGVRHEHTPEVLAHRAHDELDEDDAQTRAVHQHERGGDALSNGLQAGEERAGAGTEPHGDGHVTQSFGKNRNEIGIAIEESRELLGEDEAENADNETHDELSDETHLQRLHESLVECGAAAVGDEGDHAVGDGVHGDEHEELHAHQRPRRGDGCGGLCRVARVRREVDDVLVGGDRQHAVGEADHHARETHVHHLADQLPVRDEIRALDGDGGALGDEEPEAEGHGAGVGDQRGVGGAAHADAEELEEDEVHSDVCHGGDNHKCTGEQGSSFASHQIVGRVTEVVQNVTVHQRENVLLRGRECTRSVGRT